jgi:methionyl-tRNA synthetase
MMKPFLPFSSAALERMLGKSFNWNDIGSMLLMQEGDTIHEAQLMYEKIEDETIDVQLKKLEKTKQTQSENTAVNTLHQLKADITYDEFDKLDLRVGKVLEAERVPKADKLLKLIVDLGFEKRTILSGIAEYYTPEELVGKLVTVVANLAPRKIRGIESQGMLLMAGNDFGKLYSVGPEKEIEPGSVVK